MKNLILIVLICLSGLYANAQVLDDPRVFNAEFYLRKYPDLRAAFGSDAAAALNHYNVYGINEGRQASPGFDPQYYLGKYPDLQAAFGKTNYHGAIVHYINYGFNEKREGVASNLNFNFINEETKTGGAYRGSGAPDGWILSATDKWMRHIPDNTKLSDISIPGTHDSGATTGGAAAQAQSWTILQQLQSGIRFLDIRVRRVDDKFGIYHDVFNQFLTFDDVMDQVKKFLEANPSETVVMNIQHESIHIYGQKAVSGDYPFWQIWNTYQEKYKQFFYAGGNSETLLRNTRGKVFILTNENDILNRGYGMAWGDITDIQNLYKVYFYAHEGLGGDWAHLPSKKKEIKNYIEKAITSKTWVVNYLSGSTGMIPSDVAYSTNSTAYDYIGEKGKTGRKKLGMIIMDFPGEQLIYRIIKSNFSAPPRTCDPVLKNSAFYLQHIDGNYAAQWVSGSTYYYPGHNSNKESFRFGGGGDVLHTEEKVLILTDNTSGMKSSWRSYNQLATFNDGVGYWNHGSGNDKANWTFEQVNFSDNKVCFDDVVLVKNASYQQYLYPYPGKNYLWTKSAADDQTKWVIRRR